MAEQSSEETQVSSEADAKNSDSAAKSKCRGSWRSGLISGLISGIISSALVSFALTPTGHATEIFIARGDPRPTCANPQWLLQVPDNEILADSYYFSVDTLKYFGIVHTPDLSVDDDLRTAWLEWWPPAVKRYDYIDWTFPNNYNIRLICITDGWAEDSLTYSKTLPIRTARLFAAMAGKPTIPKPSGQCLKVPVRFTEIGDYNPHWQGVPFHCKTSEIVLQVDSMLETPADDCHNLDCVVDPANKKDLPLTGLSEVEFYYSPGVLSHMPF
jgi:hypothetical protein